MNGTGKIIQQARIESGLSVQELAERMRKSRQHIGQLESDKSNPTLKTLQDVANALDKELKIYFA